MSQENRKEKLQTAQKTSLSGPFSHTGSFWSKLFLLSNKSNLEICQKQNGNKTTLRFLSYLGKLISHFSSLSVGSIYHVIFQKYFYMTFQFSNIQYITTYIFCRFLHCRYNMRKVFHGVAQHNNEHSFRLQMEFTFSPCPWNYRNYWIKHIKYFNFLSMK